MPVAYITGATSGIGRATAERFIEEGWTIVAMARREERLQELQDAHPGSVHCFKLDVRDKAAVEHVFSEAKERFGAPDVLVNNAGLALGLEPAQACSLDDWDNECVFILKLGKCIKKNESKDSTEFQPKNS